MKKVCFVLISLLIIVAISGCGLNNKNVGQESKEDYISKEPTNYVLIDRQKEVDGKTDWALIDNYVVDKKLGEGCNLVYLKENHPEVLAVKKVAEGFFDKVLNVDYKTVTGEEGMIFFDQNLIDVFKANNLVEKEKRGFVDNQVIEKATGNFKYTIVCFNKDFTRCRVEIKAGVRYISATQEYLKGLSLNKDYYLVTTLWFVKENDVWKIDLIDYVGYKED